MNEWLLPFLFGLAAGILSAWGVGGGTLLLLAMTLLLDVPQRTAQTVNLLFFLPTAAVSLLFHVRNGYLDRAVWQGAVLAGLPAAAAGAILSLYLDPALLRPPFGLFLLYAGVRLLQSTLHDKKEDFS